MKKLLLAVTFAGIAAMFSSCGMIDDLRNEAYPEAAQSNGKYPQGPVDAYGNFDNRSIPPPPITVDDDRTRAVAGTPIDYSGERAKSGRVTKNDFAAEGSKNDNSLWHDDGQNNYLFAQNKMHQPGDILTVIIEDDLRKDMVGQVKNLLPPEYRNEDVQVPGLTKTTGTDATAAAAATPPPAPPAAGGTDATAAAATPAPALAPEDMMTAEILERYPNGNLRVRGVKRIPFRTQVRTLEVNAIVKNQDVDEHDQVKSSKFFDHRVEMYR